MIFLFLKKCHNFEKPAVLTLETMTGKEDRFKKIQTQDQRSTHLKFCIGPKINRFWSEISAQDSYQDIEVEQDAAGNVTGFVIGGLTGGVDTINTFNKVCFKYHDRSIIRLQ